MGDARGGVKKVGCGVGLDAGRDGKAGREHAEKRASHVRSVDELASGKINYNSIILRKFLITCSQPGILR